MNLRILILLFSLLAFSASAYAQLSTVYVDATYGSDSYTGANPTDSPSGTGPKATIDAGLKALANGGRLVIFAGTYAGDGVDTDGSPTNPADNADIDINLTKYPRLISGLTIELRALLGMNEVRIFVDANSVLAPNGALVTHTADQYVPNLIFNIPEGTLTITTTNGTEYLSLAAAHSSGSPVSSLLLMAGSIDIAKSSFMHLRNGALISIEGSARFVHEAPQKENDLNLTYHGSGSFTAGAEAAYLSFGAGTLTVNKDAGSTITFASTMAFNGNNDAIRLLSGNATFNAPLMLGSVGSPTEPARTADLIINTDGAVRFNSPVTLVVANGAAVDSSISTIDNAGNASVTFQQMVTWTASYNSSSVSFPASESTAFVWNAGNGNIAFAAGATFTHAATTTNDGPVIVEARIQNNNTGQITFGGPITVVPRTETSVGGLQQFSVGAINNAGGVLEISGTLRSGLVNAPTASPGGVINITGPTTLGVVGATTGALVNGPNKAINLGANTLTLSGSVNHSIASSFITATTGGFLVNASGAAAFDGGNIPGLTISQPFGGSTTVTGAISMASLTVTSGTCLLQSSINVLGAVTLNGGTLTLEDGQGRAISMASLTVTSGTCLLQSSIDVSGAVTLNGGTLTLGDGQGRAISMASLTVTSGTCLLQSSINVSGAVTLNGGTLTLEDGQGRAISAVDFLQAGGILNLGGNSGGTLRLQGNFARSVGSFSAGTGSSVALVGTNLQSFNPGPTIFLTGSALQLADSVVGLQLASLDIENSVGGVQLLRHLRIRSGLTIGGGCKLDLGPWGIALNGDGAVFTNNGSFRASGVGIVIGGPSSVIGGAAVRGSEIHAGAGSSFSSFTIDVGSGNTCSLKAPANVTWSGTLSLVSGSFDIASAVDFCPSGPGMAIVRDVANFDAVTFSAGTFNQAAIHHTLRCVGSLLNDYTVTPELASDLANTDSLVIDVNSDTRDNDGNLATGQPRYFQFPGAGLVYKGSLTVGSLAAVQLASNGTNGQALELSGTNVRHAIRGILKTADPGDVILITGAVVTVAGSAQQGDVSLIGNIGIGSTTLCAISGMKGFLGTFATFPASTVTLSMGSLASQQRIQGILILNGLSFTLGSNVEAMASVVFNSGTLHLDTYNLQLTTAGDFVQSPDATGFTMSTGCLVMNRPGAQMRIGDSETSGLPNLQILAPASLAATGRVTRNLIIGSAGSNGIPSLTLGKFGNDLIFTGSTISLLSNGTGSASAIIADGSTDGTPGGRLYVAGQSVSLILNGDYSIEELTYNPPAINGTLSILSTDQTPRVLTISDILTHAGGQIGLGFNHLAFTGTGSTPGRRAYNRSDGTISASTGEFRFVGKGPQQFSAGTGLTLPNLRLWNPSGVTKSAGTAPLIVTGTLDLSDGVFTFDAGSLILENDASVVRRKSAALLSGPPSFRAAVNVSYLIDQQNGNLTTGLELPPPPAVVNNLRISNPNVVPDSSFVRLDKSVIVGGTLSLDAGQLDWGSSTVTISSGATIDVAGGRIKAAPPSTGGVNVSAYNLVYHASAPVTANSQEFQADSGITISKLSILGTAQGNPTVLYLNANRTVGSLYVDAPRGGIQFGAPGSFVVRNFAVRDSFTIVNGSFTNTSGTNGIINLTGSNKQVMTLPASGLVLPGGASAVDVQLNNPSGFVLQGGDLSFGAGSVLFFVNGVLSTGDNAVVLSQTAAGPGFDRQSVVGANVSHILGKVRHSIAGGAGNVNQHPNGRYEFPTGTPAAYRPLVISFANAYPAKNPALIEVSHVDSSPDGILGLPVDGQAGVRIGSYAKFYWRVASTAGGLGDDQLFDLEATVKNPGFRISKVEDLRFIRRRDDSPAASAWNLHGSGLSYITSSLSISAGRDTVLTERVIASSRGLNGAYLFTIGIPTEPLAFTQALPDTSIRENQALRFSYAVSPQQPGRTIVYSLLNPPTGAVIDSLTGVFTWTPASGQAGTYTVVVAATDGQYTVVTTATVSVAHINRKPVLNFRVPSSGTGVKFDTPATFKVSVTDPDHDPVTYTWKVNGVIIQVGADSTFTYTFQKMAPAPRLTAVFADPFGLSDSTVWIIGPDLDVPFEENGIPAEFVLEQNYPNPFNPSTVITVALPERARVQVAVYTLQGQRLKTLFDGAMDAGYHRIVWDGSDEGGSRVSSGMYLCRMIAGSFIGSRKMVLLR